MKKSLLLLLALFVVSQVSAKDHLKKFLKNTGYVYVPEGSLEIDSNKQNMESFYLFDTEVSNLNWLEFIHFLRDTEGQEAANKFLQDSTLWNALGGSMEPYTSHYHDHPAFMNYPVVNISVEKIERFCAFLESRLNETYGEFLEFTCSLPTKEEWIYAGKGGLTLSPYSWGGPYTRNAEGGYLANYKPIGDQQITETEPGKYAIVNNAARYFDDGSFGPAAVVSYNPNGYGLFNMCGNVAEVVKDGDNYVLMGGSWNSTGYDIQLTSQKVYSNANPFTGFRPKLTIKVK